MPSLKVRTDMIDLRPESWDKVEDRARVNRGACGALAGIAREGKGGRTGEGGEFGEEALSAGSGDGEKEVR